MPRPSFGVYPKGDDADLDYIEEVSETTNDLSQPHNLPRRSFHRQTPPTDHHMDRHAAEPSRRARVSSNDTQTPLRSVTPRTTSTFDIDHHARGGAGGKRKTGPSRGYSELRRMAHGDDRDEARRRKRARTAAASSSSRVFRRAIQINIDQGDDASSRSVFVNSPPSAAAVEMSALTGNYITRKNSEAFISFIQQGVFSEEYIRSFFPSSSEPEMTAEEIINQAARLHDIRRQKLLGLYGQGELEIDGQRAEFKVVSRSERCQTCMEAKRDCYRVSKDRFYTANTCALCFQMSKGCSFNRTDS